MFDHVLSIQRMMSALGLYLTCCMPIGAQTTHSSINTGVADSISLHEVVVHAKRSVVGANEVSRQLDQAVITHSTGQSLATLLENVSGLSAIRTGTIVAKPVIHGMYGNRILLVSNGARLTGQQWGADHAPEVDKSSYADIEVVKGAEAVRYGSEALGGIIIMNEGALPYGQSQLHGQLTTLYGSNGQRGSLAATIEGTVPGNSSLAWRVHANYENGGDRKTAHYLLNNTGEREHDVALTMGYSHGPWRLEGSYQLFNQKLGVMQSAQMGNEQLLQERIRIGQPVTFTPFSRSIGYPYQQISHHTAFAKAFYHSDVYGDWSWQTTFQADNRRENRIRRMNHSDIPTVSLHLISLQNALHWGLTREQLKTEAGLQLLNTKNDNERGTGVVPIIPNYTEWSLGLYALQRYITEHWGAEAGVRFDYQQTKADGYDWTGQRYGGQRNFGNLTYTLGAHFQPNKYWKFTTNLGLAWRAPHVYELYSNGNELSSGMFVRGDSTLRSEQSYKWVTSISYHQQWLSVQLDAYLQWINHYIYDEPTHHNIVVVSGAYPIFQYRQTSAFFRGIDLDTHFHPIPSLDYHLVTALIWANERHTHQYLPYIPSTRITQSLLWTPLTGRVLSPRLGISHRYVSKQRRFNLATDLVSFTPAAYHLVGLELGADWQMSHHQCLHLSVIADNLLNKAYKEYTNRSRYYAHDMGRDIRCIVTWNF